MRHETALIHPMACVTDSDVGAHAKIWQFASVIRGAIIGEHAQISSGAMIDGSYVGDHSIVAQTVSMGPGFVVGRNCFVGPNVTFCNDSWPRAEKAGFAGYVCATAFASDEERKKCAAILVEDGASIGANATILPGVILGKNSMVAAGSVCGVNVPERHLYVSKDRIVPISAELESIRLATRCRRAVRMHSPMVA